MVLYPTSPIQVLENTSKVITVYWPFDRTGRAKFYNIYWSPRKTGTYTLLKKVPNAIGFSNVYNRFDFKRSDLAGVTRNENFYIYYRAVGWDGVEEDFDPQIVKVIYPERVKLDDAFNIVEQDTQKENATEVDFWVSDIFESTLSGVRISRSEEESVEVTVSLGLDISDDEDPFYPLNEGGITVLYKGDVTSSYFTMPLEQEIPLLDTRPVRVQITGITTGSCTVEIARKKIFLPYQAR